LLHRFFCPCYLTFCYLFRPDLIWVLLLAKDSEIKLNLYKEI
jgi:hypothetical protein